jgi:glycopeptide antibiotics resistance protein
MHPVVTTQPTIDAPASAGPAARPSRRARWRPRRRSPAFAFFCAYAFFVVYGTLLPFQFIHDRQLLHDRWNFVNWNPFMLVTGEATPVTDVVINIAFFLPLGFIGFHAQQRRSLWAGVARSALTGLALSAAVEAMQFFTPSRNPSTSDVMTNTAGALLGALLAAFFHREVEAAVARRVTAWTAREPLLPVVLGYAMVVCMAALVPFDLAWSVSELRHALRVAQLNLAGTPAQWTSAVVSGVRFAVLAGLATYVVGRVHRGSRAVHAALAALGAALLAIGLELGQLLVRSHVFATRDLVCGVVGSGAGALAALGLVRAGCSGWGLVAVLYAAGIVGEALVPFEFRFSADSMLSRLTFTALIPYSSYYFKANVAAVADFLDGLITWLPFAFVLARLRSDGRRPDLRSGLLVITWCAVLALGVEILQLGVPRRYPEISDVLTAALGAALGAYAWSWCAHRTADLATPLRAPVLAGRPAGPCGAALHTGDPVLAAAATTTARASS